MKQTMPSLEIMALDYSKMNPNLPETVNKHKILNAELNELFNNLKAVEEQRTTPKENHIANNSTGEKYYQAIKKLKTSLSAAPNLRQEWPEDIKNIYAQANAIATNYYLLLAFLNPGSGQLSTDRTIEARKIGHVPLFRTLYQDLKKINKYALNQEKNEAIDNSHKVVITGTKRHLSMLESEKIDLNNKNYPVLNAIVSTLRQYVN